MIMMRAQDSVRSHAQFDLSQFNDSQTSNSDSGTEKAFSDSSDTDSYFYVAKVNDSIDLAMAEFLNTDNFGKTVALPVIRIDQGLYMIGLLKYSLRMSIDKELIGANTGLPLKEMIQRIHEKQVTQIENLIVSEQKNWPQIIKESLIQMNASEQVVYNFEHLYDKSRLSNVFEKRERGRQLRIKLSSPNKVKLFRFN